MTIFTWLEVLILEVVVLRKCAQESVRSIHRAPIFRNYYSPRRPTLRTDCV